MAGKGEEIKGRVEESVGGMTGNEKMERKGQIDQTAGQAKQAVTKEKRDDMQAINQATREAKRNLD
ncbi:MAG: CsbD-like [Planctomycetaceae bacterium]|nr:CsbD-like [Planctomycetaceae bacterium]